MSSLQRTFAIAIASFLITSASSAQDLPDLTSLRQPIRSQVAAIRSLDFTTLSVACTLIAGQRKGP